MFGISVLCGAVTAARNIFPPTTEAGDQTLSRYRGSRARRRRDEHSLSSDGFTTAALPAERETMQKDTMNVMRSPCGREQRKFPARQSSACLTLFIITITLGQQQEQQTYNIITTVESIENIAV